MPFRFSNGDTRPELLIRSRYLLFKSADKWTERQKERAKILFEEYPDIKMAYGLSHSLRMIFSKNTIKDAARLSMAKWYNKVDDSRMKQFNVIASTFYEHYDEILNFYNKRSSNAAAESFNAKIKLFRANLHGVLDKKILPLQNRKAVWLSPLIFYCSPVGVNLGTLFEGGIKKARLPVQSRMGSR